MRFQVFPVTHAFNQRPWRCRPLMPSRSRTRSWSQGEEHALATAREPQPDARLLAITLHTRADKIAQLRRDVESGAYCVSAEQIAEKIVREALVETLA
jgi:anti-sigma28 factor (negative regulator of flagellin synthesis)